MAELLRIDNLTVAFEGEASEQTAVRDVSLAIGRGETLALVGESGCGKTVLCKTMLKLLCSRGRVRGGRIVFDGKELTSMSERELVKYRGKEIAMIFQDPMTALDPAFSVGEQIAEVIRLHEGASRKEAARRAVELMEAVHIPEAEKRYSQRPYQFSGGMRQRIVIALSIAANPKLLLADEPTTALDSVTRDEIIMLLRELRDKTDAAILFITHDLGIVEDIAERVAIMKDGSIVEEGNVADVFASPKHEYTKKLLGYLDYGKDKGHNHRGESSSKDGGCETEKKKETAPLLSVNNLCKSYPIDRKNSKSVINNMSFSIDNGEIVGLVGRSGSGKSTLSRCICGLETPDSGSIDIREGIGMQMIFQDSQSAFNDRMTVGQIIAEPLRIARSVPGSINKLRGRKAREAEKKAVEEAIKAVELPVSLADRRPYELSGGQRQRVAIARALITNPDFIIADEPLTGLDVSAQAQIVHLLKKLSVERGMAILFIAHDLPMVNHISDRIIRLDAASE